ncbi:MAG: hypothetical protein AAGK47_07340 [Bacteroidota bacterium]
MYNIYNLFKYNKTNTLIGVYSNNLANFVTSVRKNNPQVTRYVERKAMTESVTKIEGWGSGCHLSVV